MPSHRVRSLLALVALVATGCSGGGGGAATTPTTVAATTTTRPDDGVFLVGLVVPSLGEGVEVGTSVAAAVTLAAQEINAAGGVAGQRVQLVRREEGDNPAAAELAVQNLVQLGADAIIGPTSSVNVLGALHRAVDGGVLTCAPTATALALDAYPDGGLFLRTAPSDSLQAAAIATVVEESGTDAAFVLYLDDSYGRPLATQVEAELRRQGTTVAGVAGFTAAEESLAAAVEQVADVEPSTVVVVADATLGPLAIAAVDEALGSARPTFVVNDAIRRPAASVQPFGPLLAPRVSGVSPLAYADDPVFADALLAVGPTASGLYAHNGYDCLNLIALAAESAGSTRSGAVAAAVAAVSSGGTTCRTFATCSEAMRSGRNVDYDGPGGAIAIAPSGDPSTAVFERFGFDDTGRDVGQGLLVVGDD